MEITNVDIKQLSKHSDALRQLCAPLFMKSPISYVEYNRYYHNGEFLGTSTLPERLPYIFGNKLYPTFAELEMFHQMGLKVMMLSEALDMSATSAHINKEKYHHNIQVCKALGSVHRLCFVEKRDKYFEVVIFSADDRLRNVLEVFMNNIDFFIAYAGHVIKAMVELYAKWDPLCRIILPDYNLVDIAVDEQNDLHNVALFNGEEILKEVRASQHLFTNREGDCLRLLALGQTMKNIAKVLNISPRTVEMHLRNVKERNGINTKQQLIDLWRM
ncbi:MAG: LuxR family transcriptional regulator [Pseudomonadota bacterium]|nr:LuxR family transcriptional regulator [Pseudomonadota bacterium]